MPTSWSALEVDATVSSYFAMLDRELRSEPYNKSEYRRRLHQQLADRSDTAIERKHQNISAILIDLGFPYISGYKPLGNYQHLLFEIVDARLNHDSKLKAVAAQRATEPASVPHVQDILSRLVEPPHLPSSSRSEIADRLRRPVKADYLALEARNRSLGAAGEEFAVRFERVRLSKAGLDTFADRVERVSTTRGDAEGFDILSFEFSGRERLIEVKTTSYGDGTPFFVTPNEVATSADRADQYFVYRLFNFREDPKLFVVGGEISRSFGLTPSEFIARVL